jgi:hypothetical protein
MKNLLALCWLLSPAVWAAETTANPKWFDPIAHYQVDIKAGSLKDAMQQFVDATNAQVVYGSHDAFSVRTNAVKGDLLPDEMLGRILAGTELTYRIDALGRVVIESRASMLEQRRLRQSAPHHPR